MSTEADKLRAEGVTLELGGARVAVRFTHRGKAEVEKRFGSCVRFEAVLNAASADKLDGPIFTACLGGLAAGLAWTMSPGRPSREMWDEERIDSAMESTRLGEYLDVLFEAWEQSWPAPQKGSTRGNADGTTASSSPGPATSGSPSSDSASALTSSGT